MHRICRPWITLRNGKRLYASAVGKRAFCWDVEDDESGCVNNAEPAVAAAGPTIE